MINFCHVVSGLVKRSYVYCLPRSRMDIKEPRTQALRGGSVTKRGWRFSNETRSEERCI